MLLKSKSEQERRLLSALVNKVYLHSSVHIVTWDAIKISIIFLFLTCLQLGDPENKVASNADYHLANILAEHPNMKVITGLHISCHFLNFGAYNFNIYKSIQLAGGFSEFLFYVFSFFGYLQGILMSQESAL